MKIEKLFENFRGFVNEKNVVSIEDLARKSVTDLKMQDPMEFTQSDIESLIEEAGEIFMDYIDDEINRQLRQKMASHLQLRENVDGHFGGYISNIISMLEKENPQLFNTDDVDSVANNVSHVVVSDMEPILRKEILRLQGSAAGYA